MSEFQLTHIALVGARLPVFSRYGYRTRDDLTMRRVAPVSADSTLAELDESALQGTLKQQLPIWVHNIITDPEFPQRPRLLLPLRRFEGELRDNKNDEVIAAVLSHGFRNQPFDPMDLPSHLSVRERCAILAQIGIWEEAYQRLENELLAQLTGAVSALDRWCEYARHPDHRDVD